MPNRLAKSEKKKAVQQTSASINNLVNFGYFMGQHGSQVRIENLVEQANVELKNDASLIEPHPKILVETSPNLLVVVLPYHQRFKLFLILSNEMLPDEVCE